MWARRRGREGCAACAEKGGCQYFSPFRAREWAVVSTRSGLLAGLRVTHTSSTCGFVIAGYRDKPSEPQKLLTTPDSRAATGPNLPTTPDSRAAFILAAFLPTVTTIREAPQAQPHRNCLTAVYLVAASRPYREFKPSYLPFWERRNRANARATRITTAATHFRCCEFTKP